MRPDDLEFLIAQYADGTLDARQAAELEAVLRDDPAAQTVLADYRATGAALAGVAGADPVPDVRWDRLAASIGRRVSATGVGNLSFSEDVEEPLSRLAGTRFFAGGDAEADLSAAERAEVDAALSADPRARLVLAEYATLDRAFEAVRAATLPNGRWDALAASISRAVAESAADAGTGAAGQESVEGEVASPLRLVQPARPAAAVVANRPAVAGRIGRIFAQPRRLALAACVLIAASVGVRLATQHGGPVPTVGPRPSGDPGVAVEGPGAIVVGPAQTFEPGSTVANVQVGPGAGTDGTPATGSLRDDVVSKPGSALVVSDKAAARNSADQKKKRSTPDTTALFPR
ncbi:MAG: hypothetical protein JWO31_1676 [Phycisphaerales bacterium]|nr:hypothetical protein [Phycisphaerales bacterium]